MADIWSKKKRSEVMSRIRGSGNKETELVLASLFRKHRISGWRRKQRMPGNPDFVFYTEGVAVFVDGCFWHFCPKHRTMPKTNRAFWKNKLETNRKRDASITRRLRTHGWKVLRIWEHDLVKRPDACIRRMRRALEASQPSGSALSI